MQLLKIPTKGYIPIILVMAILFLSACNYPGLRQATEPDAPAIYTAAAETVQAQLTMGIQPTNDFATIMPSATTTLPAPTTTNPGTTVAVPTVTKTQAPPPTAVCDLVNFVKDVTIPDNTQLEPGTVFVKTWRLRNAGTCAWNSAYTLVFEGDNLLNAPAAVPITTGTVPPGSTIDVSVTLTAPNVSGTYRQNFKLANASGVRFALGDGTKPFWAQIKVVVPTGIVYDFLTQAPLASWNSGVGSTFDTPLTFGGADDDANGVAKIKEGAKLETGAISGKLLFTVPKHTINGVIAGTYPPFQVQNGDHIKARVGFLTNADGNCGAGKVSFQVHYQEGATTNLLGSWDKTCYGALQAIDIDISSLAGRTVQVIFLVRSDGDFQDDWAIWNSPRIER
jgi:hypothetical protein